MQPPLSLTLPGLADARHVVLPAGIVSSGYPAAEATLAELGLFHDPWQADMARCILAKDAAGDYAADTVVESICRQVGKTYKWGTLVFADSIVTPETTTVWTAHRFKVARETFDALRSFALMPSMLPHIDPDDVHTAAGNEQIRFRNGSRIVFAARERGSVRGVAKVRRLILDEAQILTHAAMSDLAPTMNQAKNPQIALMGTPPKPSDPSEVFSELRETALGGPSEGLLYFELGADPGCDLDDRAQWAKANPSYPRRTPDKSILRLRKLLSDEDFAREALGIWSPNASGAVISAAMLGQVFDPTSRRHGDRIVFGVAMEEDRSSTSIVVACLNKAGKVHLELVDQRDGSEWAIPRLLDLGERRRPAALLIDSTGPAGSLLADRRLRALKPRPAPAQELRRASGGFYDAIRDRTVALTGAQGVLNASITSGRRQMYGDTWEWRLDPGAAPLRAATLALHAWTSSKPTDRTSERRAVVL